MSFFKKLFGGTSKPEPDPVDYQGFQITPCSYKDGAQYRLSAKIEKTVAGEAKTHQMVRADTFGSQEAADEDAIRKAKVLIDQMGDGLF